MPTITRVQIEGSLQWRYKKSAEGPFVAVCDALKLTLESDSWSDLLEDMALAIDAILKEMFATNEFERFLRDRGWNVVGPIPNRLTDVQFEVPFEIAAAHLAKHGPQKHLH
jgi:hypothetical protein